MPRRAFSRLSWQCSQVGCVPRPHWIMWPTAAWSVTDPPTGRKADAEREPSLLLPDRPLPDLAPVLVDVIFETIERIREQDDTVLLLEQNALAALEIAEYLYVLEFGKLNMLGEAPKLLDDSFVAAANLEGHW